MLLFVEIVVLIIFNVKGKFNIEISGQYIVRSDRKKKKADLLEQKSIEKEKNISSQRKIGLKIPVRNSSH